MTKPTDLRVERLEAEPPDAHHAIRVTMRPDLTIEEGKALERTLPTIDEKGRPVANVVIAGDDCNL